MNSIISLVVIVLQFLAGQLLGFGIAFAAGVGNGWELVAIPIGNTLGVWGVGALAARVRKTYNNREYTSRLIGAALGSALGIGAILITTATGFGQLLYPLVAAIVGYYLFPLIRK